MKHRSLVKMLILNIVTLGIYRIYWLFKTRREMVDKKFKVPSVWLYLLIYAVMFASVMLFLVPSITNDANNANSECAKVSRQYRESCFDKQFDESSGEVSAPAVLLFYGVMLLVGPLVGVWYWKYAKAVEGVTKDKMTFPVAMIVLLAVPDGFDMLMIQDGFNKTKSPKGGE